MASRLSERAHQDREIVYFLQQPETHAFALYHDYTESRPGIGAYVQRRARRQPRVEPGGAPARHGRGAEGRDAQGRAGPRREARTCGEPIAPETEVVVIRFPAVQKGQSVRLRISETYTDAGRYYMDGDEFVWDRSLGRPRNAVVLPAGWYVTASSIPAVVTMTEDGRVRLELRQSAAGRDRGAAQGEATVDRRRRRS